VRLEELQPGATVRGVLPDAVISVVNAVGKLPLAKHVFFDETLHPKAFR
jgi:hypothetical protein